MDYEFYSFVVKCVISVLGFGIFIYYIRLTNKNLEEIAKINERCSIHWDMFKKFEDKLNKLEDENKSLHREYKKICDCDSRSSNIIKRIETIEEELNQLKIIVIRWDGRLSSQIEGEINAFNSRRKNQEK